MKSVSINGIARVDLGKKFSKKLRNEGQVPCVIYSKGKNPSHLSIKYNELKKIIYSPNVYILNVNIGEKAYNTIIRDIQFHPLSDNILHVDFLELTENELVSLEIPVQLKGNAIGVRNGGVLNLVMRKLLIKSLPKNLPDVVELDITELTIGSSIRISDIKNESYNFLQPENGVIVSVKTSRNVAEEEEEVEGEESTESEGSNEENKEKSESESNDSK